MRWTEAVFEIGPRGPVHLDAGREAMRIHLLDGRREAQIGRHAFELFEVGRQRARIFGEILARTKLRRIDEDGDDDPLGVAPRRLDERKMPRVQRAHRRDKPDALAVRAPGGDPRAQRLDRVNDGNIRCHDFTSPSRAARPRFSRKAT